MRSEFVQLVAFRTRLAMAQRIGCYLQVPSMYFLVANSRSDTSLCRQLRCSFCTRTASTSTIGCGKAWVLMPHMPSCPLQTWVLPSLEGVGWLRPPDEDERRRGIQQRIEEACAA
eukprot:5497997-Amphidinium_carterae.1